MKKLLAVLVVILLAVPARANHGVSVAFIPAPVVVSTARFHVSTGYGYSYYRPSVVIGAPVMLNYGVAGYGAVATYGTPDPCPVGVALPPQPSYGASAAMCPPEASINPPAVQIGAAAPVNYNAGVVRYGSTIVPYLAPGAGFAGGYGDIGAVGGYGGVGVSGAFRSHATSAGQLYAGIPASWFVGSVDVRGRGAAVHVNTGGVAIAPSVVQPSVTVQNTVVKERRGLLFPRRTTVSSTTVVTH